MQFIAFMHGSTLFIRTEWPVRNGRVQLLDPTGRIYAVYPMDDVDFLSIPMNCPSGRYILQIRSGEEISEKHIYL